MLSNLKKIHIQLPSLVSDFFGSDRIKDLESVKLDIKQAKDQGFSEVLIYTSFNDKNRSIILGALKFAKSLNLEVGLLTFGVELDKEKIELLKKEDLDYLVLRTDSFNEEVLSEILSVDQPIEKIKSFLECAHSANIKVVVEVLISFFNYKDLSKQVSYFLGSFREVNDYYLKFVSSEEASPDKLKDLTPRFMEVELELFRAFNLLNKFGKKFIIEGVPLCYCCDNEKNSYELNLILNKIGLTIKKEHFSEEVFKENLRKINESYFSDNINCDACKVCFMRDLCPKLRKDYFDIFGCKEIYPLFKNPDTFLKNEN